MYFFFCFVYTRQPLGQRRAHTVHVQEMRKNHRTEQTDLHKTIESLGWFLRDLRVFVFGSGLVDESVSND
jgi:hypothetical protein